MYHLFILFKHHIDCSFLYFCALTLSDAICLGFSLFSFFGFCFGFSFLPLASWLGRLEPIRKPPPPLPLPSIVIGFGLRKKKEAYEKLNIFRSVWAERKVMLDELDLGIRRNFERKGWLPLLDFSHPSPAASIREFYLKLFVHSNDSNEQYVMSWIRGEEYTITPLVVAFALGVPLVRQPV